MNSTFRFPTIVCTILAAGISVAACSSSDPPTTSSSTGGTPSTKTAEGGATSTTTTPESTGGNVSTTTATDSSGGAVSGGATSTGTDAGGAAQGGTTAGGGAAAGGATGGSSEFQPICGSNLAGTAIQKNVACTASDVQLCYKSCGPKSVGFKSETCTAGVYAEVSNSCLYPAGADYSCFKVPTTLPDATACGITAEPQASQSCTAPACTLCAFAGQYKDSGGGLKTGYCVCVTKTDGSAAWSCAGTNIWPCPGNNGC